MDDLKRTIHDCIVVGSGPAGVMCAQTLVEAGTMVLMIDAGISDEQVSEIPDGTFEQIRKTCTHQHNIFLGENAEALNTDAGDAFGQLTPQRKHGLKEAAELMPVFSESISLVQSLAEGGLGAVWGLGCYEYSDAELKKVGLDPTLMRSAYQVIADRIGISYTPDDIAEYIAPGIRSLQDAIYVDENAQDLLKRYNHRKQAFNTKGFYVGKPGLALLTNDKGNRKATAHRNMDFYANEGDSAYRPSITLRSLQKRANFRYHPHTIVQSFQEDNHIVKVSCMDIRSMSVTEFACRKLILAANVTGTARIVLRSLRLYNHKLPLLCNPYSLLSCVQFSRLGKINDQRRTSTAQLSVFFDKDHSGEEVAMASVYSYSSLMLFRLMRTLRLNFNDGLKILRYLQSSIVIAGIHHPDESSQTKFVSLKYDKESSSGDHLQIEYSMAAEQKRSVAFTEKQFAQFFWRAGCTPVKKITPPAGASAHYAGTLPFGNSGVGLNERGLLIGTNKVYVADASGFRYLPAKGPTFTIMANAHLTALNVLHDE